MQLVKDFEIIAIEDVRKLEGKMSFKFQRQDVPFENTQFGITQLQNGFFNLLRDFILILPDASIQEVSCDVLCLNNTREFTKMSNLILGSISLRNSRHYLNHG